MYFTYIPESSKKPGERYIGHTSDLNRRIKSIIAANVGTRPVSSPGNQLYIAFETLGQAQKFERYLKSGSGHGFANRHFWA